MNRRGSRHAWILFLLTLLSVSLVTFPSGASSVTYTPKSADPTPPKESYLRFAGGKKANKVNVVVMGAGIAGCLGIGPGACGETSVWELSIFDSASTIHPDSACLSTISRHVLCRYAHNLIVDLQGGNDYLALVLPIPACIGAGFGCRFPEVFINGGFGDDSLRTLNLTSDTITCGDGLDTVLADASDDVAPDCENVTRI